jgi:hypothetical protein
VIPRAYSKACARPARAAAFGRPVALFGADCAARAVAKESAMKRITVLTGLVLVLFLGLSTSAWAQVCPSPPGELYELFNWHFWGDGIPPKVALYGFREDTIVIHIEDGTADNVQPDEVLVHLTAPWWMARKEVSAWGCSGRGETIATDLFDGGPKTMRLVRGSGGSRVDTIVLAKHHSNGTMQDVYALDPAYFFWLFAGKAVTLDWHSDTDNASHAFATYTPPTFVIPLGNDPTRDLTFSFNGKLRDRVRRSSARPLPDGLLDGTFTLKLAPVTGARHITRLRLTSSNGVWDTDPTLAAKWVLGAAIDIDGPLLNASNGAVDFTLLDGGILFLFASDGPLNYFVPGTVFTLTIFADGPPRSVTATVPAVAPPPPPPPPPGDCPPPPYVCN